MKITHLMTDIGYSGGYIVIYHFIEGLIRKGIACEIATPSEKIEVNENNLQKIFANAGKKEPPRPFHKRVMGKIQRTIRPKDEIDRIQDLCNGIISNVSPDTDIVVATAWKTAFAAFALSEKYVPLYHIQNYEELFCVGDDDQKLMTRSTYGLPLNMAANSSWLINQLRIRFGKEPYLLNPPIDLKVFNVDNFDWRQKFNDSGKIRIVALSDSRKYKAFPVLAEIIRNTKAVMRDRIEWTLFGFYNPGDIGCDYKYAGTLFKRELADLYRTAHIVVMPSWCDSFAIPPIEGMACGALGVCIESGSEDYGINGKNCLVFKPMDINGISEGIIRAASLKSGIGDIVAEGIKTSLEFSIDKRTDAYVDIFNKIRKNNVSGRFKDINDMLDGIFYR